MKERDQEFRALGFRCIQSVKIELPDGSTAMVKAHSFRDSKTRWQGDPTQMRTLRHYELHRGGNRGAELFTELELEELLGAERFKKLV